MVHESRHGVGNRSPIEASREFEAEHQYSTQHGERLLLRHIAVVTPVVKKPSNVVSGKHGQQDLSTECV